MWTLRGLTCVSARTAIGVCFSLTDIFRSDILAVVMNQLVDEPVLPTLFMRTVSLLRVHGRTPLTPRATPRLL